MKSKVFKSLLVLLLAFIANGALAKSPHTWVPVHWLRSSGEVDKHDAKKNVKNTNATPDISKKTKSDAAVCTEKRALGQECGRGAEQPTKRMTPEERRMLRQQVQDVEREFRPRSK